MPARRILQLGDPTLREISAAVTDFSRAAEILTDLRDTLHQFQRANGFGRGISAVQIGELQRIIYIEFEGSPYALINPVFQRLSAETFELWDDCFSFPTLMVRLRRSLSVQLRYFDEKGAQHHLLASGAFAELLQHEMDHLDGILAVDRAIGRNSLAMREQYLRSLENA
ncbi:MAG: peptide deformylase [Bryobacteraceae bacterium]|nr:peptide deformylase [Bryobacteraceae bacterium]